MGRIPGNEPDSGDMANEPGVEGDLPELQPDDLSPPAADGLRWRDFPAGVV